jgi:protein SCO1
VKAHCPGAATEPEVDDLVRRVRSEPWRRDALIPLLREDHPLHEGRGTGATARVRSFVLAAFADVGLPDAALPYVAEELESGDEPILVAAAAQAARGRRPVDPMLKGPLVTALWNMAGRDDTVSLDTLWPSWPATAPTTPVLEVLATLRELGPGTGVNGALQEFRLARSALLSAAAQTALDRTIAAAAKSSCCSSVHDLAPVDAPVDDQDPSPLPVPDEVEVEDQDGERLVLAEFLRRAPTVLAFFYTRCGNPRKCSLTITSLGVLGRELAARNRLGSVQIAAITYDPGYDLPARLRRYGRDRGLSFGPAVRMFRAVAGHQLLRDHLALRVGYGSSVVNRHGIELFLLDGTGRVVRTWARHRWEPAEVLLHVVNSSHPGRS